MSKLISSLFQKEDKPLMNVWIASILLIFGTISNVIASVVLVAFSLFNSKISAVFVVANLLIPCISFTLLIFDRMKLAFMCTALPIPLFFLFIFLANATYMLWR
jgi:hypothetical protein